MINASVGFNEATLQPTYELKIGVPGASAGINIAQRLGLNPAIIESARSRLGTQARDVGEFLDRLHASLREAEDERLRLQSREQELEKEKIHLAPEGKKEQQAKIREMEKKLESVLRDFEYHAREQSTRSRTAPPHRKFRKMPSAASPNCAANFASNSIPPLSPTPAAPIRAIPTPSRKS